MRKYRLLVLRLTAVLLLLTPTSAGVEENSTERAMSFHFSSSALSQTFSPTDCLSPNHQVQGDVDKCLLGKLSDQAYFGIDPTQVSDQQMLDYITKNREALVALLLQVDYGRDLKRFVGYQDQILATQNESAFLQHLQTAQSVVGILGQVADVLSASQQTAAWTAASESLNALGQVLFGIQVYQRFADVLISSDLRQALSLYFENRLDTQSANSMTPAAAWNDAWSVYGPVLLSIGQAKGMSTDQLSKWFENAFVAYRLVGYSDSSTVRLAQGQAIARLAAGTASAAKQVVVAGFQTIPTPSRGSFQFGRDAYYLVPMVIYDGSRYKFLPHDVPDEDPMVHPLNAQDFLGQSANPNSPRVRELIQKSILSKVNLFDVYRKGRKVGYFTVKNPVYVGPFGQVVAVGTATGFTPTSEDIAIAGALSQPDFLLPLSKLNLTQTKQLDSMVMALLPKTIPTNPVAPTAAGQPIRLRTTWENLNVLDPQRSGNLVVSLERKAVVTSTVSVSFTASSFVLARYNTQTKSFDKLASWAIIAQGNKIVFSNGTGDEFLITFKGVLDVSGDGIPELILLKGIPAASPELLLYEFQNGKLHLVGSRGWEVGFELTTPETISGLYGTD